MALSRSYILASQFEDVSRAMDLRRPQRESLRIVYELLRHLPGPIQSLSAEAIVDRARQVRPDWTFPSSYPSLTFALATGVGKTRLMGAIAAYLYRTGESRNFVILAPRDAILRKLEVESREGAGKYIFVDPAIVPQPRVCHRGNLLDFRPAGDSDGLFGSGPNLFIFSPQLLVVKGRIAEPSEFVGSSILDYLRACQDLVIFVDESHHLSAREHEEAVRTWGGTIAELEPKLVFEMTATPRSDAAIAYEYGLAQCLRERLYTKAVRMIVDERGGSLGGEEYDRYTLDFALDRLRAKETAIRELRERMPGFPAIRPVLLVCATDTRHADRVGAWLIDERGFARDEVLVIHSNRKTEEDMAAIAAIEQPDSRVRVVVQVHVFDEGWDVTNVYVIAPLRNVQSYINARQVMGRGLRLPAGRRVGDEEVDTLDVLAFGQETFQAIYDQASAEFGAPDRPDGGIDVVRAGEPGRTDSIPTRHPDDEAGPQTKVVPIPLRHRVAVEVPLLDLVPPEPALDVLVDAATAHSTGRVALDLGTLTTATVVGDARLGRERFIQVAVDEVFREVIYLSDPLHRAPVLQLVETLLREVGRGGSGSIDLDPVLVGKAVAEAILDRYRNFTPDYRPTGHIGPLRIAPTEANVPLFFLQAQTARQVRQVGWSKQTHYRIPIGGWQNCTHELAHFDSRPEFEMAWRLDQMRGVRRWMRNEPGQLTIPTLAGNTKPDFLVWLEDVVLLLEVKGEHLWEPKRSDSWVRARDVRLWVPVANEEIGREYFRSAIILGADVENIVTVDDLLARDALREVPASS